MPRCCSDDVFELLSKHYASVLDVSCFRGQISHVQDGWAGPRSHAPCLDGGKCLMSVLGGAGGWGSWTWQGACVTEVFMLTQKIIANAFCNFKKAGKGRTWALVRGCTCA